MQTSATHLKLLEAPDLDTPVGHRDRAILGVLANSACRVGELARLRVRDFKESGGHKVLELFGKGGKERRVPLHPEAVERILAWLDKAGLRDDPTARCSGQRQPLAAKAAMASSSLPSRNGRFKPS